ncbi:MAG: hypothetical protein U0Y68_18375 [Blastocatellia bacterium]
MGNAERVRQLKHLRTDALGLGTRTIKIRLNKLAKSEPLALAVRLALEIEDANLTAKRYRFSRYQDRNYKKKDTLIRDLITLFKHNDWTWGVTYEKQAWPNAIIYFEIPGCEQISWHWNTSNQGWPIYEKEWDGKQNSTLPKLFAFIQQTFPEITGRDIHTPNLFPLGL